MSWEMLATAQAEGFSVGSHTKSHCVLTNEGNEIIRAELTDSRKELEVRMGGSIRRFAYPDGRYDRSTLNAAADAGYRAAYSTCRHRSSLHPSLTIPRRVLWEHSWSDSDGRFSDAIMRSQMSGLMDIFRPCRQNHGIAGRRNSLVPTLASERPLGIL
jgi:peptidoglycan/xylan/chitin deacetylase (PgdA/CDA1 family)